MCGGTVAINQVHNMAALWSLIIDTTWRRCGHLSFTQHGGGHQE